LLVVWENDAGEVRFELRDPTNGDLDWVLQPVGKQRDWRIVDGAGGVVVLTDSQVSVSDLVSVRR
jgi:dethiobiotin synthetase